MAESAAASFLPVDFDHWPYPALVAHRGAGRLAPENTLAAMRVGAAQGYRMVEFDVKLTGDGKPILMHDAMLDRTTNGRGLAGAATLGEIAQLDAGSWHSPAYAGEPVPTFAGVAAWLCANGILANVEIKPTPGRERDTGAAVAMAAAHAWQGSPVPPLLSSFAEESVDAARRVLPGLPRALLFERLPDDWLVRVRRLQCVALDTHHRTLSREIVAQAHGAGVRVLAYTANEPERVDELRGWGVDCVITDAVDLIRP